MDGDKGWEEYVERDAPCNVLLEGRMGHDALHLTPVVLSGNRKDKAGHGLPTSVLTSVVLLHLARHHLLTLEPPLQGGSRVAPPGQALERQVVPCRPAHHLAPTGNLACLAELNRRWWH